MGVLEPDSILDDFDAFIARRERLNIKAQPDDRAFAVLSNLKRFKEEYRHNANLTNRVTLLIRRLEDVIQT